MRNANTVALSTVDENRPCDKSMIESQTAPDAALPPYAIDAAGFGLCGEPASRTET
jgi:hypothetical protein